MPADEIQLARENIAEPTGEEITGHLTCLGLPGETAVWRDALAFCASLTALALQPLDSA